MKTYQLRITGKVQGVWYRASAKDKAIALHLNGRVWNEPNGDVGAYVQGDENKINEFIEWCRQGPPLAEVKDVVVVMLLDEDTFEEFEIVRK